MPKRASQSQVRALSYGPVRPEMGGWWDAKCAQKSGQCDPACLPSLSNVQEKRTSRDNNNCKKRCSTLKGRKREKDSFLRGQNTQSCDKRQYSFDMCLNKMLIRASILFFSFLNALRVHHQEWLQWQIAWWVQHHLFNVMAGTILCPHIWFGSCKWELTST